MSFSIEDRFTYHHPTNKKVIRHEQLRRAAKQFAFIMDAVVPNDDTDGKEMALKKLEEAVMWANRAIALSNLQDK